MHACGKGLPVCTDHWRMHMQQPVARSEAISAIGLKQDGQQLQAAPAWIFSPFAPGWPLESFANGLRAVAPAVPFGRRERNSEGALPPFLVPVGGLDSRPCCGTPRNGF